jgi:hypothetical protein
MGSAGVGLLAAGAGSSSEGLAPSSVNNFSTVAPRLCFALFTKVPHSTRDFSLFNVRPLAGPESWLPTEPCRPEGDCGSASSWGGESRE